MKLINTMFKCILCETIYSLINCLRIHGNIIRVKQTCIQNAVHKTNRPHNDDERVVTGSSIVHCTVRQDHAHNEKQQKRLRQHGYDARECDTEKNSKKIHQYLYQRQ